MEAPMQQVYHDEEGGISVHSPLVSASPAGTPRWSKQSSRRKYMARIAMTSAALFGIYLLFCSWVAFSRRVEAMATPSMQEAGSAIVDTFPHPPKLPWPHPPKKPKHPPHHPHPRLPLHPPTPTVLACAALPTASSLVADTTTIDVTLPKRTKVTLSDFLLHGDLSVSRTDNELTAETNLTVAIKTIPAAVPTPSSFKGPKVISEEETDEDNNEEDDDDDETSDLFVLCAVTFGHPHPQHPPLPPAADSEVQSAESEEVEPLEKRHPHRRPHHPPPAPVLISIFPALNETYPKFPKPPNHHHRHHKMKGGVSELTTNLVPHSLKKALRSTVSFLFPMLSIFPQHTVSGHKHGHHQHKSHHPHPPHFPHHPPLPPPPFWIIETRVTLPRFVPVEFGSPFHRRPGFGRH